MTDETAPERKSNLDISEAHQMQCLDAIGRFGWIRPRELSRIIWRDSPNGQKFAERLLRLLRDKKLVLARQLPGRSKAYVLTLRGAKTINGIQDSDFEAGVRWGRIEDGKWNAPESWRHDLMTTGALIEFEHRGYKVYHDIHIRKAHPTVAKIPDGILVKNNICTWLEVENSHKTGEKLMSMCESIVSICRGDQKELMGLKPTHTFVAYDKEARDYRGNHLDHRGRVVSALGRAIESPVSVSFVSLKVSNYGVDSVEDPKREIVRSTKYQDLSIKIKKLPWQIIEESDGWQQIMYQDEDFQYFLERNTEEDTFEAYKRVINGQVWWRVSGGHNVWIELAKVWNSPPPDAP